MFEKISIVLWSFMWRNYLPGGERVIYVVGPMVAITCDNNGQTRTLRPMPIDTLIHRIRRRKSGKKSYVHKYRSQ